MAQINITISIGSVDNVDNLKILQGETFHLFAVDSSGPMKVFADNDAVLKHSESAAGDVVMCVAEAPGKSEIQFQNEDRSLWKTFAVEVLTREAVTTEVTRLGKEQRIP